MPCDGNPNETCGGPSRLDLYSLGTVSVPTGTQTSTSAAASASVTDTGDKTWFFRGCYTDSAARTLTHGNPVPDAITVELCQSMCYEGGYILAGIEYTDQCCKFLFYIYLRFWVRAALLITILYTDCDNSLHNGGTLAPEGNLYCDMPCTGNSSQTCGGNSRLDLYSYGFGNGTA
jgi:glucan 1,3-beta-glucosidase